MSMPESAVREIAVLNDALENAEEEIRRLRLSLEEIIAQRDEARGGEKIQAAVVEGLSHRVAAVEAERDRYRRALIQVRKIAEHDADSTYGEIAREATGRPRGPDGDEMSNPYMGRAGDEYAGADPAEVARLQAERDRYRQALERIRTLEGRPGDGGTPDYWAGIGEAADIADEALDA